MFDFSTWTNMIKDTVESAGKKTGEVLEVTKIKMQVAQQRAELSKAYEKLGAMVYDMMKNEEQDSSAVDVCIDEIDFILSKISESESKANELKKVTVCPSCGAEVALDACFCSKCGAKIEHPVEEEPAEEEKASESCCECAGEAAESCCECAEEAAPCCESAEETSEPCCESDGACCESAESCCETKEQPEA